jgi:hypothetical protein
MTGATELWPVPPAGTQLIACFQGRTTCRSLAT